MQQLEPIQDGDEDEVVIQDDKGHLEDEQILIVAELTEHEVPVVKELSTNRETVSHPQNRSNLSNHCQHCGISALKRLFKYRQSEHTSEGEVNDRQNRLLARIP